MTLLDSDAPVAPAGFMHGVLSGIAPSVITPPARILIVTDAWKPQVNGVVRTLSTVAEELRGMGHTVEVIGPDRFRTLPLPTYPDIRLAVLPAHKLGRLIEAFAPNTMHIATEGPLGNAARAWAVRRGAAFTTSFHTKFPEYVQARIGLPPDLAYRWLRRFHGAASGVMVATHSLRMELAARGFANIRPWTRGVDLSLFKPAPHEPPIEDWGSLPRPLFLNVGRVAVEKNIRAFLDLDLPGSKIIVGDGPQRAKLQREYPNVHFTGARYGEELARCYAAADVFVFPSLTDTFGLVILEALAAGTPVAAFPVTGPLDVLAGTGATVGAVDSDLQAAALRALNADRDACRAHAERFSWQACARIFLSHLVPLHAQ